ncbi:NADase-type glycan-binding domain-containing protein [Streptomyces sioyaensis]|uniref:NADase-type glycan-binding domain-containing protein n=1 Tax=Streptomyces sioyaensis TaxID=67364 RepID=UPI003D749ACA
MDPADHSGFGPVSPACDQPRAASPGAVHCPECGDGNDVRRSYCCSCGAEVRPAPESPQLTKWQLLRKRWDERPRPWHMDRRWLLLPVVLPCCFAAGVTAAWSGGAVRAVSPAIKDRFSAQVAMAPKKVEATSEAKGYQVSKAVDGVDNRGWAPDRQGADAIGQSLKAEFSRPFRLTGLAIVGGAGRQPKQYLAVGRPTRFTATAVTAGGTVVRKELRLADQPGPQDFRWGVDNVVSLTLQISDVHAGLQPRAPIGVAEVQFFTRRDT